MKITPALVRFAALAALAALAFPGRAVEAQLPHGSWSTGLYWSVSTINLDMGEHADWRPATAVGIRVSMLSHLDFEAALTSPLSTRRSISCADAGGYCPKEQVGRPDFTMLSVGIGLHADIAELRPFAGLGRQRISVQNAGRRDSWRFYTGADVRVGGPFSVGLEYSASRVPWPDRGVRVDKELGLRISVAFLGGW